MAELISLGDLPHGYDSIVHHDTVLFSTFAELIANLFSRSNSEADTNHPLVVIIDEPEHPSQDLLQTLSFNAKVLLLKYFFGHLNTIIIKPSQVSDPALVAQLNDAITRVNELIGDRISRIQTWTGTGDSKINEFHFFKQTYEAARFDINEVICTMSYTLNNHANKSHVCTDHIIQLKDLILKEIDFRSLLSQNSPQHLSKLCHLVGHWSFPAHELTNDDLVYCVYIMIQYALKQVEKIIESSSCSSLKDFHVPSPNELLGFVFMVRDTYRSGNPFHNFRHAVDVMQACFHFLIRLNCLPPFKQLEINPKADELVYIDIEERKLDINEELIPLFGYRGPSASSSSSSNSSNSTLASTNTPRLNPLQTLGIVVAALGHDVGHPGLTNAFMIKHEAPTSLIFNERSVLELFHSSVFINKILVVNWPSLLKVHTEGENEEPFLIKDLIVSSILATDMAEHFEYIHKLNGLKGDAPHDNRMVKLISSLLIKCADISNVARPLRVSSQWALVLGREFEEVASLERRINLGATSLEDVSYTRVPVQFEQVLKQAPELHKGQIFFINTFAENLFNNIAELLPELKFACGIIKENKEFWLGRAQ
ncbi:nucleotide phosphodiesterase [Suhomyces tanzawaensis NRRL Y-17324]|uniref:Phosphodiesterase n=1 Tax=Suhomyces tanzawaensis NRRL Y-17324 TaxID=984487 RepID=A0A1E4SMR5_9ASCO|nr:nucleotide phosphodiesterase [Suhomyces tanzawaensis NRRL Y-17324]ODV80824.1 nucleotide phosphodiesterase [Suhomyces tanzawaensis NRRL Y-17324]